MVTTTKTFTNVFPINTIFINKISWISIVIAIILFHNYNNIRLILTTTICNITKVSQVF